MLPTNPLRPVNRPVSSSISKIMAKRWEMWIPWATMEELRGHGTLDEYKHIHRERFIEIIAHGIRYSRIYERRLDNPTTSHAEFRSLMARVLKERKRGLLGYHNFKESHVTNNV